MAQQATGHWGPERCGIWSTLACSEQGAHPGMGLLGTPQTEEPEKTDLCILVSSRMTPRCGHTRGFVRLCAGEVPLLLGGPCGPWVQRTMGAFQCHLSTCSVSVEVRRPRHFALLVGFFHSAGAWPERRGLGWLSRRPGPVWWPQGSGRLGPWQRVRGTQEPGEERTRVGPAAAVPWAATPGLKTPKLELGGGKRRWPL